MLAVVFVSLVLFLILGVAATRASDVEHRDPDVVHVPHHGDRLSDR